MKYGGSLADLPEKKLNSLFEHFPIIYLSTLCATLYSQSATHQVSDTR